MQRFGGGQRAGHGVEVRVGIAHLAQRAGVIQPHGEIPRGHALHRPAQARDGAQKKAAHDNAEPAAQDHAEEHHPHDRGHGKVRVGQPFQQEGQQRRYAQRDAQDGEDAHDEIQPQVIPARGGLLGLHAFFTTL